PGGALLVHLVVVGAGGSHARGGREELRVAGGAGAGVPEGRGVSGEDFLTGVRRRAAAANRTLVFPEGEEPRVHRAVAEGVGAGLFRAVLVGAPDVVRAGIRDAGLDP